MLVFLIAFPLPFSVHSCQTSHDLQLLCSFSVSFLPSGFLPFENVFPNAFQMHNILPFCYIAIAMTSANPRLNLLFLFFLLLLLSPIYNFIPRSNSDIVGETTFITINCFYSFLSAVCPIYKSVFRRGIALKSRGIYNKARLYYSRKSQMLQ